MDTIKNGSTADGKVDNETKYRELQEGQAKILYIEQRQDVDEEGKIKKEKGKKRKANEINENAGAVFYNPVQEFNRDISIAVIREYIKIVNEELEAKGKPQKDVTILEALAATGLRSVRYLKEIDRVKKLVCNDWDPVAVELIKKNMEHNGIAEEKYESYAMDAIDLLNEMRAKKRFFDVIDLDPYGSAIPFLESAIGALTNGGLLAVTFTDMAVLCARKPHVAFYKYGSTPLPNKYCHEFALRMVLYMISQMANRHGRVIEPYVCLTVDFYIRLFIRVRESPIRCHSSILHYSQVYQCHDCESFWLQPLGREQHQKIKGDPKKYKHQGKDKQDKAEDKVEDKDEKKDDKNQSQHPQQVKIQPARITVPSCCKVCDGILQIGGPIWNQKMHDVEFCKRLAKVVRDQKEVSLKTSKRIQGIMTGIIDEQPVQDYPLAFDVAYVASSLKHITIPKSEFVYGLSQYGYKAVQTYYSCTLWKTNAPPEVLYDLYKAHKWQFNNQDKDKVFSNLKEGTVGQRIFNKPLIRHDISFDVNKAKQEAAKNDENMNELFGSSNKKKPGKYFVAPVPNWGPKARAMGGVHNKKQKTEEDEQVEK